MKLIGKILICVLTLAFVNTVCSQVIHLEITGIRNIAGQICVGIFNSNESFRSQTPIWQRCFPKDERIKKNQINLQIRMTPGTYGVTVLDDENMDGQMQYNILGLPLEGFGFGNFDIRVLSKPVFERFSFELKNNETHIVRARIRYL